MELVGFKIKDRFTGKLVPAKTTEDLREWLWNAHTTKSEYLQRTIDKLILDIEQGMDYRWGAAANDLEIKQDKRKRRAKK